jgi:hypothetical protein
VNRTFRDRVAQHFKDHPNQWVDMHTLAAMAGTWRFTTIQADAIGRKPSGNQKPENYDIHTKDTRNKRSVWSVTTQPYPEAHFATFPEALIEPCILAGSAISDTVLDPLHRLRHHRRGSHSASTQFHRLRIKPGICRARTETDQRRGPDVRAGGGMTLFGRGSVPTQGLAIRWMSPAQESSSHSSEASR